MTESLTDFADRQRAWLTQELDRRADQMKKAFPRPFGQVEVEEEEQVQKYIDFRVGLTAAEMGDEQAMQAIKEMREQFGLQELVKDIIRLHPMFEQRFKEGEGSGEES